MEVPVSGEHGGKPCARFIIEDMDRDAMSLGKSKFIAHVQRSRSAFGDNGVRLLQPCGILLIDSHITILNFTQGQVSDMLGQNDIVPLDMLDDPLIHVGIGTPAPDRPGKIYFLHCIYSFRKDMG